MHVSVPSAHRTVTMSAIAGEALADAQLKRFRREAQAVARIEAQLQRLMAFISTFRRTTEAILRQHGAWRNGSRLTLAARLRLTVA